MSNRFTAKLRRMLSMLLVLAMVLSMVGPVTASATAYTAGYSDSMQLQVGERIQLKAPLWYFKTTWSSSDETVATVSQMGILTGVKAGEAVITAKSGKLLGFIGLERTTTYHVTVTEVPEKVELHAGDTTQLTVEDNGGKVLWSSSNPRVAKVSSNGTVTAMREGEATVTAKIMERSAWNWLRWYQTLEVKFQIIVTPVPTEPEVPTEPTEPEVPTEPPVITYTVTFESNGGSAVEAQIVEEGMTAAEPEAPTMESYEFTGWYADAELTAEYDFATPVTADVTLYAGWAPLSTLILSNFTADENYFLATMEYTVIFTVLANESCDDIALYCENTLVSTMNDDGVDGDAVADDGIYTYKLTDTADEAGSAVYHAGTNQTISNYVTVYYFALPTEENTEEIRAEAEEVQREMNSIEEKYRDDNGSVPIELVDDVIAELEIYISDLYSSGIVIWYEVNDANILVKMRSGFTFVYVPCVAGVDSIGENVSMSIVTYQPCLAGYGNYSENYITYPDGITNAMTMPDRAASAVSNSFSNYNFSNANNCDNAAVTLDRIKSISSNQVVIWHGHGGHSSSYHSYLLTGEDFDWTAWWWDPFYCLDNLQGRIIEISDGKVCFTSKFVDKYCSEMNNTMVYLAACQSGKDSVLANAFLNKGASAVVANSETILTLYNLIMEYTTISKMSQINTGTNEYYSLSEALAFAKAQYGQNDSRYGGIGAEPKIFGGTIANNYRFGAAKTGTLSGRICKASDRTTPVVDASISVSSLNKTWEPWACKSDSSGYYSLELPVGTYHVKVLANGYIDFDAYATITEDQVVYMETFLLVEGSEDESGTASGTIRNALTGTGIAGVTLEVRSGWNNADSDEILTTITTDASGNYSVDLPLGNYTLNATKEGYISTMVNIIVQSGTTASQNGAMTPIISGDSFRIVLTWGSSPSDLDSHVVGTLSSGSSFHVYYSDKSEYDGDVEVCNLDVDDTSSYGPETITLNTTTDNPYYYYIYNYSSTTGMITSEAQIKVYQGESLVATFNVPTNQADARYWNVFAIVDGEMVVSNTVTSSADLSYANTTSQMRQMPINVEANMEANPKVVTDSE